MISKAEVKQKFQAGEYEHGFIYSEGLAYSMVILEISHGIEEHVCGFLVMSSDDQRKKRFFRRKIEHIPNEDESTAIFHLGNQIYDIGEFIRVEL